MKTITMLAVAALAATPLLAQQNNMQGMDHSKMGNMQGMDHSKMMMNDPNNPFMPAEMSMHEKMMSAKGANAAETWTRKMIEHHRGAIDMSRIVLAQSRDARTRTKAQQTITSQTKEVADLQASLRAMGKRPQ